MFWVILDRDGLLNVDYGYTYQLDTCHLTDGIVEALQRLRDAGAQFAIATGQSGIDRGKYTEADMHAFNQNLIGQFTPYGIAFETIVFCPHHPDISGDCPCRKPKTGLLRQIDTHVGPIDWSAAWGIGDKPSDSEMLITMGGRAVLLRPGSHNAPAGKVYWTEDDPQLQPLLTNPRNFVANNAIEAAKIIIEKRN